MRSLATTRLSTPALSTLALIGVQVACASASKPTTPSAIDRPNLVDQPPAWRPEGDDVLRASELVAGATTDDCKAFLASLPAGIEHEALQVPLYWQAPQLEARLVP